MVRQWYIIGETDNQLMSGCSYLMTDSDSVEMHTTKY